MHPSLFSSSMTHGQPREQGRNTPRVLVRPITAALGGHIDLDPCSNATSRIPAKTRIYLPGNAPGQRVDDHAIVVGDGLQFAWTLFGDTAFVNPPWADLAQWIPALVAQARRGMTIVALLPLRPHRVYWAPAWGAPAACYLKAIEFEGFDNKIATPCVMLFWGRAVRRFARAFAPWGRVLTSNHGSLTLPGMRTTTKSGIVGNGLPHISDIGVTPATQLLTALIEAVDADGLLKALLCLEDVTVGDLWALSDRLGSEASTAKLMRMLEAMPVGGGERGGAEAPVRKRSRKKPPPNAKKVATTNKASKKRVTKKKAVNGKAEPPSTTDQLDAQVEAKFLRGNKEPIRTAAIAEAFDVSKATALRSMTRLTEAGKAKLQGVGRGAVYISTLE